MNRFTSRPEGCPFQNCVYRVPSASIFVVQPHPADGSAGFVAAFWGKVEPAKRAHQRFGTAMISRIAMIDGPPVVLHEDARAEHVFAITDDCAVIVEGPTRGDVLGRERHAEIEIEVAAARRNPGEGLDRDS
jgi:hypothetical protein